MEKYCGKVEIEQGFAVEFGCGKVGLDYYRFEMWLVVVWWVCERSFCSQCVKRSPIEKPENNGFYYGFLYGERQKIHIYRYCVIIWAPGRETATQTEPGREERKNSIDFHSVI